MPWHELTRAVLSGTPGGKRYQLVVGFCLVLLALLSALALASVTLDWFSVTTLTLTSDCVFLSLLPLPWSCLRLVLCVLCLRMLCALCVFVGFLLLFYLLCVLGVFYVCFVCVCAL